MSPSTSEWIWVYAPLFGVLLLATLLQFYLNRIPNSLSFIVIAYFISVRAVLGPAPIATYLLSLFIAASVALGFGWLGGYVGGGFAKLATAVSPALLPTLTFLVCVFSFLFYRILAAGQRIWGRREFSGPLMLLIIIAGVLAIASLKSPKPASMFHVRFNASPFSV